jgi:polar amino acid transport system permease protein
VTFYLVRRFGTRRALLAGCLLLLALVVAGCAREGTGGSYQYRWQFFWDSLIRPDGAIVNGLYLTVMLSIVAQTLGVILGIFAALGKMARILPLRLIAEVYIWFFRGTPLLVQLALLFYGLQSAQIVLWPGLNIGPVHIAPEIFAGALIMGINEGAYMAEIVRAGILAIDPGQQEAAKSLGMTYRQTMTRIVLPQAARVIIPPLGNEFNNMLKTTSLLSALSIFELFNTFTIKAGKTYATFEYLLACALWFLLLTTIWSFIQAWIERKFAKGTGQNSGGGPGFRERLFGRGKQVQDEIKVLGGH